MIADMDCTQNGGVPVSQIILMMDANGNTRDGTWFVGDDGLSRPGGADTQNPLALATGYSGNGMEFSGQINGSSSDPPDNSPASFGFYFCNQPGYGIPPTYPVTGALNYTGISFWAIAKNTSGSNISAPICGNAMPCQFIMHWITFPITNQGNLMIPLTNSWKQYTIYFDQLNSGAAINYSSLKDIVWSPWCAGNYPFKYDIVVDQVQFVSNADPAPPTPMPTAMIDSGMGFPPGYPNATNTISGPLGYPPNYWFTYGTSNSCPSIATGFNPWGATFFRSMNTDTSGNPDPWCIDYAGTGSGNIGFGVSSVSAGVTTPFDMTQGGQYSNIEFLCKEGPAGVGATNWTFGTTNLSGTEGSWNVTLTNSWQNFSQPFTASAGFDPQHVIQLLWHYTGGGNFDLMLDNIQVY